MAPATFSVSYFLADVFMLPEMKKRTHVRNLGISIMTIRVRISCKFCFFSLPLMNSF